ncbi:MAG: hypothetical protein ACXWQO_10540 [Bdellovibrionota bacterium]
MKFLVLVLLFTAMPVFASSDPGKVVCEGMNPRVDKVSFTLEVSDKGEAKASATYQSITDDGEAKDPWNAEFNPKEMSEASIGFQHLAFVFAHHNTVWKVIADSDIYGGASEDEKTPYNGVLFLQTGNGNSSISRFNIVCRQVL